MTHQPQPDLPIIGWQEWVHLPELDIPPVLAKIDTGARTSALHAYYTEPCEIDGILHVRFGLHPLHGDDSMAVERVLPVKDRRPVRSSNGEVEERFVIETPLEMGDQRYMIEMTLTARDTMQFRMLVGRTALANHFLVDCRLKKTLGHPAHSEDTP